MAATPPAVVPVHGSLPSLTSLQAAWICRLRLPSCLLFPQCSPAPRRTRSPPPSWSAAMAPLLPPWMSFVSNGSSAPATAQPWRDPAKAAHLDCGWRRPSMPPTSHRPSRLPPLSGNKERRRVRPRVPPSAYFVDDVLQAVLPGKCTSCAT